MKLSFDKNAPAAAEIPTINTAADAAGNVTTEVVATPEPGVVENIAAEVVHHPIPATTGTEVAVRDVPATDVATSDGAVSLVDDQDISLADIILPRINIVQKVGDLSEIFTPGEVVLKQSLVIYSPAKGEKAGDPPLNITVLGFQKTKFTEKVEGGKLGDLCATEADVAKKGGTLDYKEWQASVAGVKDGTVTKALRLFQRLATALVLIEKPATVKDEDHIEFPYECEGKFYALALWSMKGTAYTHAAKTMFTARKIGHLRQGYSSQSWSLSTKMDKFGDNYAAVPVVKPAAKNSEAFRAFIKEVLGCV